jgi:hypothetical protein
MRPSLPFLMLAALVAGNCLVVPAAAEEIILRKQLDFEQCPGAVAGMLGSMKARDDQFRTEVNTGALYRVRLDVGQTSLVFRCGKSAGIIEVVRQERPSDIALGN